MTRFRRFLLLPLLTSTSLIGCASDSTDTPTKLPQRGQLQWEDRFENGLSEWVIELERPGTVAASDGALEIDVPAGATLWFKRELHAPVEITFEATAIAAAGPNDRVSDIDEMFLVVGEMPEFLERPDGT